MVAAGLRGLRKADGSAAKCCCSERNHVNRNSSLYLQVFESEIENATEDSSDEIIVLHRTMKSTRHTL